MSSAHERAKGLEAWLRTLLAAALGVDPSAIDVGEPISSQGLDSVTAAQLHAELERHVGRKLPITLIWDYPTLAQLADHLALEGPPA